MKLKQSSGDFRVFEQLAFEADPAGIHHVHKVIKEKLGTLEALDRIARAARVPRSSIAYAGLKDRQAITQQFISIENGRVDIDERDLKVRFLGRSAEKITSKLSSGNRFHVVVRDLDALDIARLRRNRRSVQNAGLPNYFDDQRFGCLAQGQGFVVRSLANGRPDLALRQLIASPPAEERGGDAKLKRLLRRNWGDWETCHQIARGPMYDVLFTHLRRRPEDFAGALERIPTRLKLIHLFAFQSWLWNLGVHRWLRVCVRSRERVFVRSLCGDLLCWRYLADEARAELAAKELPLIDHRTRYDDARFEEAMGEVLGRLRLSPRSLRIDIPGFRLVEEPRRLVLAPEELTMLGPWADERNEGRLKVELRFGLRRGAYATLVVRRLLADPVRTDGGPDRSRKPGRGPSKGGASRTGPPGREARRSSPRRRVPVLRRLPRPPRQ